MTKVMRTRIELVKALIEYEEAISPLMKELRAYGWDSKEELAILKPEHVIHVLKRFQLGELNAIEVKDWANAIERREDIELQASHRNTLDEMVFWLANPEINFSLTTELANRVINNLQSNHVI